MIRNIAVKDIINNTVSATPPHRLQHDRLLAIRGNVVFSVSYRSGIGLVRRVTGE